MKIDEQVVDGKLEKEYYRNDTLFKRETYYENRRLRTQQFYQNGYFIGNYFVYYPNGNIAQKGFRINGLRDGKYYEYFENDSGKVKSITNLFNIGEKEYMHSQQIYNRQGQIIDAYEVINFLDLPDTLIKNISYDYKLHITDFQPKDSAILITGSFDNNFQPLGELDTIEFTGPYLNQTISIAESGYYKLRGQVILERVLKVDGDTLNIMRSFRPFEKNLFVKG